MRDEHFLSDFLLQTGTSILYSSVILKPILQITDSKKNTKKEIMAYAVSMTIKTALFAVC
jgi:hypothetical protein